MEVWDKERSESHVIPFSVSAGSVAAELAAAAQYLDRGLALRVEDATLSSLEPYRSSGEISENRPAGCCIFVARASRPYGMTLPVRPSRLHVHFRRLYKSAFEPRRICPGVRDLPIRGAMIVLGIMMLCPDHTRSLEEEVGKRKEAVMAHRVGSNIGEYSYTVSAIVRRLYVLTLLQRALRCGKKKEGL